ncbi:uncharacterized protein LOC111371918 [Olea europaea var. sylvestris]|uniref:uncharacterized protein LOC111371918 n=1 Tax=Olea europaea var. sylvestris TaxID=158386 RepID=UPI000C1D0D11|nr:uncharacterized protein LOC111371918 [Olea europaea var. sylvestris]
MASSSTSIVPPSTSVVPPNNAYGEKSEKFTGVDFKRWQQKMLFYLTTLNLVKILKEDAPTVEEKETNSQKRAACDAWSHSDFLCRNYILNCLDNTLYNVYYSIKTAKLLWESLEEKYKTEDAGLKKFVVGKFLDFKMVDSKTVMTQVQEIQLILHDIHAEGMKLCEPFQIKIEEDNRNAEKKSRKQQMETKVNLVKPNTSKKRKHPNNNKQKSKAKKFKRDCYNCGKPGHIVKDCRQKKQNKKDQVHLTEEDRLSNGVSKLMLSTVVFEANMVDNPRE